VLDYIYESQVDPAPDAKYVRPFWLNQSTGLLWSWNKTAGAYASSSAGDVASVAAMLAGTVTNKQGAPAKLLSGHCLERGVYHLPDPTGQPEGAVVLQIKNGQFTLPPPPDPNAPPDTSADLELRWTRAMGVFNPRKVLSVFGPYTVTWIESIEMDDCPQGLATSSTGTISAFGSSNDVMTLAMTIYNGPQLSRGRWTTSVIDYARGIWTPWLKDSNQGYEYWAWSPLQLTVHAGDRKVLGTPPAGQRWNLIIGELADSDDPANELAELRLKPEAKNGWADIDITLGRDLQLIGEFPKAGNQTVTLWKIPRANRYTVNGVGSYEEGTLPELVTGTETVPQVFSAKTVHDFLDNVFARRHPTITSGNFDFNGVNTYFGTDSPIYSFVVAHSATSTNHAFAPTDVDVRGVYGGDAVNGNLYIMYLSDVDYPGDHGYQGYQYVRALKNGVWGPWMQVAEDSWNTLDATSGALYEAGPGSYLMPIAGNTVKLMSSAQPYNAIRLIPLDDWSTITVTVEPGFTLAEPLPVSGREELVYVLDPATKVWHSSRTGQSQQPKRPVVPVFGTWPTEAELRADLGHAGFDLFVFMGVHATFNPGIYGNSNIGVPAGTPITVPIKLVSWMESKGFSLDSLIDVVIENPAAGQRLEFNGNRWVNVTPSLNVKQRLPANVTTNLTTATPVFTGIQTEPNAVYEVEFSAAVSSGAAGAHWRISAPPNSVVEGQMFSEASTTGTVGQRISSANALTTTANFTQSAPNPLPLRLKCVVATGVDVGTLTVGFSSETGGQVTTVYANALLSISRIE